MYGKLWQISRVWLFTCHCMGVITKKTQDAKQKIQKYSQAQHTNQSQVTCSGFASKSAPSKIPFSAHIGAMVKAINDTQIF